MVDASVPVQLPLGALFTASKGQLFHFVVTGNLEGSIDEPEAREQILEQHRSTVEDIVEQLCSHGALAGIHNILSSGLTLELLMFFFALLGLAAPAAALAVPAWVSVGLLAIILKTALDKLCGAHWDARRTLLALD
jgi:hypothetical protein